MDKVKGCKLTANITPYSDPTFKYPDYKVFYAAEIGEYVKTNPISSTLTPLSPLVTCTPGGTSSTTQTSSGVVQPTPTVPSGIVQPPPTVPSGIVQPPTPSPTPVPTPTPAPSASIVPPTSVDTSIKATKVCVMEPANQYSSYFDKIASNIYILNSIFAILATGGSYLIWTILDDTTITTILNTPSPASTPTVSPSLGIPSLGIPSLGI